MADRETAKDEGESTFARDLRAWEEEKAFIRTLKGRQRPTRPWTEERLHLPPPWWSREEEAK